MTKLSMTLALLLIVAPPAFAAGSGPMSGGGDTGGMTSAPRMTPQQMAVRSYNAGLKHKERAQEYEAKAATATNDKDKQKQLAKAKDQYEDAIDDYRKAIGYDIHAYQAMNELGFAFRKVGNYEDAVKAYNAALAVKSDFAPAIEYRGEAYLALSQFKQVQDCVSRTGARRSGSGRGVDAGDGGVAQHASGKPDGGREGVQRLGGGAQSRRGKHGVAVDQQRSRLELICQPARAP